MSKITVRFSEEEDAILRAKAEEKGVSVSELMRECLFPDGEGSGGLSPIAGQLRALDGRLDLLGKAVGRLQKTVENGFVSVGNVARSGSGPPAGPSPASPPGRDPETDFVQETLRGMREALQDQKRVAAVGEPFPVVVPKTFAEVRESQRVADLVAESLRGFCREMLPLEIRRVTEVTAKGLVGQCVVPLTASAKTAALEIDACLARLVRIPWGWRLLSGPVIAGLVTVSAGALICYQLLFSSGLATMRRYAEWGHMIEQRLNNLPPKDHEKVLRMIGLWP